MANLYSRLAENFPRDRLKLFAKASSSPNMSYADLERRSAQYASVLVDLGVQPGDRVAVQAPKSLDMLMLYLGCLRAAAIFLPLNTSYTAGELSYFMENAEPALFVCAPGDLSAISMLAAAAGIARVETLGERGEGTLPERASAQAGTFDTREVDDDTIAAILYTSGTTGRSKGAMLSHGNLASNCLTLRDYWRFTAADRLIHALPIFHTHGLFVATNVVLAAGAEMIFLPGFDAKAILEALPAATTLMGVPTFYIRLLKEEKFTRESVAHMRLFVSGSAPLSIDVHQAFQERTGQAILERYGMTETNMNTSNPYDGERRPGTVGYPLPGVDIRIVDQASGQTLSTDEVGEIEIRGPNVFKGYWRMPEKTAAEFHEDYFMSGDLGLIDQTGYVSIVGRAKDLVISGGYNIYPVEVETALDELAPVRESAVIGVGHPDLGEGVVGVVVPIDPEFEDGDALKAALGDRLARYKQPRQIVFVEDLPRNAMGKVQKMQLRERFADVFAAE